MPAAALGAAVLPSLTQAAPALTTAGLGGAIGASGLAGTGLTIGGSAAGTAAMAPMAKGMGMLGNQALGAGAGFKGLAGGAKAGGLMNLFKTPKGLAALGQGVGALGQVAGLMIGGEKGRDLAKSGAMFQMISGLAPDISEVLSAFKNPDAGTNLQQLGIGGEYSGLSEATYQKNPFTALM